MMMMVISTTSTERKSTSPEMPKCWEQLHCRRFVPLMRRWQLLEFQGERTVGDQGFIETQPSIGTVH